jgi:pantetheine-phosphate adenylyltransferase
MTIAIYPGTFDPITCGHVDLVKRSTHIFSKIIVAVAKDTRKATIFTYKERLDLAKEALKGVPRIEVLPFVGLLVNFANRQKAKVILRGLRAVSDFEYELQLADVNQHLDPSLETLFSIPSDQYSYISSSMVREIASLGGDISKFVPKNVAKALTKFYQRS